MSISHTYKELLTLSLAFTLVFTAYSSLQNLQSSLNQTQGLGVLSLSCIYGSLILSCFIAPTIVKRLGYKLVFMTGWLCHSVFTATNFYPRFYTLLPSSVLLGLITGPIWTAQGAFLTTLATKQVINRANDKPSDTDNSTYQQIVKFNGIFYMLYQSKHIWGNLISSLVIHPSSENANKTTENYTQNSCGAGFCPYELDHKNASIQVKHDVSDTTVNILLATYLGCDLLGIIQTGLLLGNINEGQKNYKKSDSNDTYEALPLNEGEHKITANIQNCSDLEGGQNEDATQQENALQSLRTTLKSMLQPSILILTPMFIFSGAEQAWLTGEFTQAFTTCILGVSSVGYTMMGYGVSGTVMSYLTGMIEKCIPRVAMFITASSLNFGVLLGVYFWHPGSETIWVFFLVPVLWGAADTIWMTQISSHIGINFPSKKEDVFAIWRLWQAFGIMISFAISHYVCMSIKLYSLMALVVLSMVLFIIDEVYRKTKRNEKN